MKRPGKPRGQYYLSLQTLDSDHGIIIGLTVTPGGVHDTVPYLEQVEAVHQRVIPLQSAAADSAYDFPLAHRELEKLGIDFFVRPQPAHDRTQVEFKRDAFTYDAAKDVYIWKVCTVSTAACSGNTGPTGRTAAVVLCEKNVCVRRISGGPGNSWTVISSPPSSGISPDAGSRSTGRR